MTGKDGHRASLAISLWTLAVLATTPCSGAPAWGSEASGILLAVDVASTFAKERRVLIRFKNLSKDAIEFAVGGSSGTGSMYNVQLQSITPDGQSCQLLDTTVGFVGGSVTPIVLRLPPGATDYISIDLKKLICLEGASTLTLDRLLSLGYSIMASFSSTAQNNSWAKIPQGWTGTAASGVFRTPAAKVGAGAGSVVR